METIISRGIEETDELACDHCSTSNSDPVVFLVSKWDTEAEEYYISDILCGKHKEELFNENNK